MRYHLTPKQEKRFWSYVDRSGGPDACWPWMRCTVRGYGVFGLNGKNVQAHRIAFTLVNGDLISLSLHRCDNRPCCNPTHLYDGTHKDNVRDMDARGRRNHPDASTKARGEAGGNSKLTEGQIRDMRTRHVAGEGLTTLARAFAVDRTQVWNIVTRRQWKHIP